MAKYSGESSTAAPVHQPFIKMTSPISLVKLNQVILKLQSFHEEKIQAREKADEFFSQFRQRYKPKSCPYLRPTLKKFKKVRNKYHNDKQREASYQFLAFNHYYQQQGYFLILLAFWVLHSLYLMCKSRISQIMDVNSSRSSWRLLGPQHVRRIAALNKYLCSLIWLSYADF
ncbi:uncharacterized protein LOC126601908 isoform X3 [Malus sylvestris]|uniref:uncharacterized protein LOC126601908 isoform X3 n=1 Tax=Malus sylvestris TaxID=3752 RepID=UPI0021ABFB41|nr:uncharacterized protein LOC126601908 isoform X3 [Malus sylvestris]